MDRNFGGATVSFTNPDAPLNGDATGVTACAYGNPYASTTVTTLHALNAGTHSLYLMNPPTSGTLGSGKVVKLRCHMV